MNYKDVIGCERINRRQIWRIVHVTVLQFILFTSITVLVKLRRSRWSQYIKYIQSFGKGICQLGSQEGNGGWNDHKLSVRQVGLNAKTVAKGSCLWGAF
jgi:hypothetical protein